MLGGENTTISNEGLLVGTAIGLGLRMRNQARAHEADLAEMDAVHAENLDRFQGAIYNLEDQLEEAQRQLREARRELAETQRTLAAERCEIAGLNAFIEKVQALDPKTAGFRASGEKYSTGHGKAVATLDYERAYDLKAVELGYASLQGTYAK